MTKACPHFHFMNECRHKVCRLWKGVVITMKIPQHVAIILDGNGRWAKSKGMPRNYGHTVGAKNVETVCKAAHDMGIKYLTMYAFSTENWNRPEGEVAALMKLLESYLKNCIKTADKNNMRVRVIGDTTRLSDRFQAQITELEAASANNDGLNLQIAINYGSRDEMIRAMKKLYQDMENGTRQISELNEDVFASYLDTAGIPDPDLLIRTSGEQRLSNYLLWQLAYSEFYFTDVPWPDFGKEELEKAVEAYNKRDRRFGGLTEKSK
jgi:undecaprenyl diphosphate synthase